ncbi:MAG: 5-formyltetrahydrofolate cyclo-ligase [Thermodesulfobacteriota bacterium]
MKERLNLRKEVLKERDQIAEQLRNDKSQRIAERVLAFPRLSEAQTLFVYVSFRSEVATFDLISQLLAQGREILVPLTLVNEKRLLAVRINDLEQDLEPGYCGIPEPREELVAQSCDPKTIDTVILPGSVFDERGGRLGYGGGYYDRFLSQEAPGAYRLGLAFEEQLVKRLSLQPHDELLDTVITEKRIISSNRR